MDKAEIKRINTLLSDIYKGICEDDEPATMQLQLTELYRLIKTLMNETFKAKDKNTKILLASLELRARQHKQQIEQRLAMRN